MHSKPFNVEQEDLFLLPQYQDELCSTFPEEIYRHLPDPLKSLFENINNPYERDILLLGSITVLSGCMPNVIGFYDRKWVSPNLYTFIEAPAGSGKGVLSWTRLIGMEIHKMLLEETRLAKQQFDELKKEKIKNKDQDLAQLKEPPYKLLFIPANNSASSVVQTLSENDGAGILFSTEADTLANALAQDWGNFSDVLRGAFHHEPVEMQRRQNREHFSV
ncbi:MAG: YfjI family protein, partial [Flavobacteriales bacterium]|nr:YfjI family protein [Flavobacteriales bacterium]